MPTETIHAPGHSYRQKLLLGLMMACKPCGCGSGSGGGGSGGGKVPCCDAPIPIAISWAITGISGIAACLSGTAVFAELTDPCEMPTEDGNTICDASGDCLLEADDLNGFNCGPAANASLGSFGIIAYCKLGDTETQLRLTICCVEPPDDDPEPFAPRYRFGAYFSSGDGVTSTIVQWCTEDFNVASCEPFVLEIHDLAPHYNDGPGTPLLTVVLA